MRPILSVRDVAERYGVRPLTVRQWLSTGKLGGFRAGTRGRWRIPVEEVEAFEDTYRLDDGSPRNGAR